MEGRGKMISPNKIIASIVIAAMATIIARKMEWSAVAVVFGMIVSLVSIMVIDVIDLKERKRAEDDE